MQKLVAFVALSHQPPSMDVIPGQLSMDVNLDYLYHRRKHMKHSETLCYHSEKMGGMHYGKKLFEYVRKKTLLVLPLFVLLFQCWYKSGVMLLKVITKIAERVNLVLD